MIFLGAKIKPWVVDKWNSYDQSGHTFSFQNTMELLVEFFKKNMIHAYPHVSSLVTQKYLVIVLS